MLDTEFGKDRLEITEYQEMKESGKTEEQIIEATKER